MRSGEVQAHLPTLVELVDAPAYLPDLVAVKADAEHGAAPSLDADGLAGDVASLHAALAEAESASALPAQPTAYDALHDLVVRSREAAV
jgi:hypothetical protein